MLIADGNAGIDEQGSGYTVAINQGVSKGTVIDTAHAAARALGLEDRKLTTLALRAIEGFAGTRYKRSSVISALSINDAQGINACNLVGRMRYGKPAHHLRADRDKLMMPLERNDIVARFGLAVISAMRPKQARADCDSHRRFPSCHPKNEHPLERLVILADDDEDIAVIAITRGTGDNPALAEVGGKQLCVLLLGVVLVDN